MHILHDPFLSSHLASLPATAVFLKINWSLLFQGISTGIAIAMLIIVLA